MHVKKNLSTSHIELQKNGSKQHNISQALSCIKSDNRGFFRSADLQYVFKTRNFILFGCGCPSYHTCWRFLLILRSALAGDCLYSICHNNLRRVTSQQINACEITRRSEGVFLIGLEPYQNNILRPLLYPLKSFAGYPFNRDICSQKYYFKV